MDGLRTGQRLSTRLGAAAFAAFAFLLGTTLAARAAQTDISSTPIPVAAAAAVKPNIMLLMDTSDSMKYTHMPDGVEFETGKTSVGYKSSSCNSLYYDPAKRYYPPVQADGSPFAEWPFDAARYDGFGESYTPKVLTPVDLGVAFQAYDNATIQVSGYPDTAKAAYYYRLTGGTPPARHDAPACKDSDTGATRPATGGGTWTRVVVSSTSGIAPTADERQNFANWYSYYRTRILLTKSAASLAFAPMTSSYRLGFITMQPKTLPSDALIDPDKFLAVRDFDTAQRAAWFQKLFSQSPYGSSPAREGLARVGRYYGGQEDTINAGMAATGVNDPIQYSCQQNFTIMTTDGYWNTQTESTGFGGPLRLDGKTPIIQADGDYIPTSDTARHCPLSDPYCPRPIHDGAVGTEKRYEEATQLYSQVVCSLPGLYRTTTRVEKQISQYTKTFTHVPKNTVYWTTTREQDIETKRTITKRSTTNKMTTEQFMLRSHQDTKTRWRIMESQYQTKRTTQQQLKTSSQAKARTYNVEKTESRQRETSTQVVQVRRQWKETREQVWQEQRQFVEETRQVEMRQKRITKRRALFEQYDPVVSCGPPDICREEYDTPVPTWTVVKPTTCTTPFSQDTVNSPYVITECRPGQATTGPTAKAACTVAVGDVTDAGPPWVRTICVDNVLQASAPAPYGSCNQGTVGTIRTFCTTPSSGGNNQAYVPGNGCTADPRVAGPYVASDGLSGSYVRTTCSYNLDVTTNPSSCTPTIEAGNIYRGCDAPTATNYDKYVIAGTCPSTVAVAGQTIVCGSIETQFATAAVDPATCPSSGWISGDWYRTCNKVPTGADRFVSSCNAVDGSQSPFEVTECAYDTSTNFVDQPVNPSGPACVQSTPTSLNDYLSVTCYYPTGSTNETVAVPPGCMQDLNPASPYVKITCNTTNTVAEFGPVDPALCPVGDNVGSASDYFVQRCRKDFLGTMNAACAFEAASSTNGWIQTECGGGDTDTPVLACPTSYPLNTPVDDGNGNVTTCYKPGGPNNTANLPVLSCSTQNPLYANSYVRITCDPRETFAPQIVKPSDCVQGEAGPDREYTTCTPNDVPSYVTNCTYQAPAFPGWVETLCSPGPNFNSTPTRGLDCGATDPAIPKQYFEQDQTRVTCRKVDTTVFVAGTPPCQDKVGDMNNGYENVTCGAVVASGRTAQLAGACTPGPNVDYADETTVCGPEQILQAFAPTPFPCAGGVNGNEKWTCNPIPVDSNVLDPGCVDSDDVNSPYTRVRCTAGAGANGWQLRRTLTRTTTISKLSGTVVVGTPSVTPVTDPPVDIGMCQPTSQMPTGPNPVVAAANDPPVPSGCSAWPCTFVTDPGIPGSYNSLADVAQYYYKTDLRSDPMDPKSPNKVKPQGLPGSEDDFAPHQHMTTFVVGLGVSGTMKYRSDYRSLAQLQGDFAAIRTGQPNAQSTYLPGSPPKPIVDWPTWPDPLINYTSNTDLYADPRSIDDFWHTAVNGRGRFFSANDPTGVVTGIGDALTSIAAQSGSGAADGASSFAPTANNNFAYVSSYKTQEWTGDLRAFTIDLGTGALNGTSLWSAKDKLDLRVGDACDNRSIYLIRMGGEYTTAGNQNLVNFAWNSFTCDNATPKNQLSPIGLGLDAAEKAVFDNGAAPVFAQTPAMTDGSFSTIDQRTLSRGELLVNFLRGQRGREGFVRDTQKLYRQRVSVLGDFVNSQPVFVGAPFANYQDVGYAAFVTAHSTRAKSVYIGGNDGMLHAFDADTGAERWAVIPRSVLPELWKLAETTYKNQHAYFVDGTPTVGDVYDAGAGAWKTILVGGLNAGGTGFYALDVTDPAAPKALWEFRGFASAPCSAVVGATSDCNVGYSFGKPVLTKVNGTWVALLTSGYNNTTFGDGGGYLYIVNAATGRLIQRVATGAGDTTTPSGLAQINNFVDDTFVDNASVRAYGGDVLGNVWRFQFTPTPSVTKIGETKDAANNRQPITVRPELAEIDNKPVLYVGTGKLLHQDDVLDTNVQSIYSIVDPLTTSAPVYADLRTALKPLVLTETGTGPTAKRTIECPSALGSACNRTAGWYVDLRDPTRTKTGERVNVEMKLLFGTLVAATNVPTPDACDTGGYSWLTYLDYKTGLPISSATLTNPNDPNSGNISSYMGGALIAGFNIYQLTGPNNNPFFAPWVRLTSGGAAGGPPLLPTPPTAGKRISWREIAQ